jgi:hypothetical protein
VLGVFIGQSLLGVLGIIILLLGMLAAIAWPTVSVLLGLPDSMPLRDAIAASPIGLIGVTAAVVTTSVSLLLAIIGIMHLGSSRLQAYRWLERSALVSVLLVQVILFWLNQLAAVVELAWHLLLLASVRYAIRQEEGRLDLQRLEANVEKEAMQQAG